MFVLRLVVFNIFLFFHIPPLPLSEASSSSFIHLYKKENHSELLEQLIFFDGETCKDLTPGAQKRVTSVDTLGSCFQLFDQPACKGHTIWVASRRFAYNNLKGWNFVNRTVSVSVCGTMVDFYAGKNYTGYKERVQVFGTRDCVELRHRWQRHSIRSVDTHGGCVNLHDGPDCTGKELQLRDGPHAIYNLKTWDFRRRIRTVSACDDFDQSRSEMDEPIKFALYNDRLGLLYEGAFEVCGCRELPYKDLVTSVATNGHCFRLYADDNCQGRMVEFSPESGFHDDLKKLNFALQANSVSTCHDIKACLGASDSNYPSRYPNPEGRRGIQEMGIFAEYLPQKNGVVIKINGTPSHDHFCELTRRCSQNRRFDCDALKNEGRCYCVAASSSDWDGKRKKVVCDSDEFRVLNNNNSPTNFEQDVSTFRFPIAGEFRREEENAVTTDRVYFMSSHYEAPFAHYCELQRRCEESSTNTTCIMAENDVGGRGFQSWCLIKLRGVQGVFGQSSEGVKARRPASFGEEGTGVGDDFDNSSLGSGE